MELHEQVEKIIQHRRSIFPSHFSGEEVAQEVIEAMVESARWAPTHKFTEPWRFTIFTGEGLKRLADYQGQLYKSRAGNSFDEAKFEKLQRKPLQCSHIIAIGMRRDPELRVPEVEEVCAVACAVQNMLLTAAGYHVGAYWSTGGITYYDGVSEIFEGEEPVRLMGFIYVGMPKKGFWPRGNRSDMEDKVSWVIG